MADDRLNPFWGNLAKFATNASGDVVGFLKPQSPTERALVPAWPDVMEPALGPNSSVRAGACARLRWEDCTIGSPTSGWTFAKDSTVTYGGMQTLKVTATAGAAANGSITITVPSGAYIGNKGAIGFAYRVGDRDQSGDANSPIQMKFNYSASAQVTPYGFDEGNSPDGSWIPVFVAYNRTRVAQDNLAASPDWTKFLSEELASITITCSKIVAGNALDVPIYISPILVPYHRATLTVFFDGPYTGVHRYARHVLQSIGVRASMAIVPYWLDYNGVNSPYSSGTGNSCTRAEITQMYNLGWDAILHTGTKGPASNENVGWNNTAKYPNGAAGDVQRAVQADIASGQAALLAEGWTRGNECGVVGFGSGLSKTYDSASGSGAIPLARRLEVAAAVFAQYRAVRQTGSIGSTGVGNFKGAQFPLAEGFTVARGVPMITAALAASDATTYIDNLIASGGWGGFIFHDITLSAEASNNINIAKLQTIADYIDAKIKAGTLRCLPFSEAMAEQRFFTKIG